jgi:hypothetical protein
MDQEYWLGRKRASMKSAKAATSSGARLIHYDLAGRHSLRAMSLQETSASLADVLPPPLYAARGKGGAR